ncbi:Alpha/Beta hydrolase protein [Xylariaceae sp. FL0255]|nr:Alpha/Beta hydrolase protein [Xylariaceae sp. FL0255]
MEDQAAPSPQLELDTQDLLSLEGMQPLESSHISQSPQQPHILSDFDFIPEAQVSPQQDEVQDMRVAQPEQQTHPVHWEQELLDSLLAKQSQVVPGAPVGSSAVEGPMKRKMQEYKGPGTNRIVEIQTNAMRVPCKISCRIIGNLESSVNPLVIVHGGPGYAHEYLLPLAELAMPEQSRQPRPLVFYDQMGCGGSAMPESRLRDDRFWVVKNFAEELDRVLFELGLKNRSIDVYGHGWGGIVAIEWAALFNKTMSKSGQPHLNHLILSNCPARADLWEASLTELGLRERTRLGYDNASGKGEGEKEWQDFMSIFYKRHLSLARRWPASEVKSAFDNLDDHQTAYDYIWGSEDFHITGTLKGWEAKVEPLNKPRSSISTLLINGSDDMIQDHAIQPLFNRLKKVKWIKINDAAHMSHIDQREEYLDQLRNFLDIPCKE